MKRNLDLIRDLLLALETESNIDLVEQLTDKGYSKEAIGFHSYLLGEAGFAKVAVSTTLGDSVPQALALSITWHGYEFLDSAREPSRWEKAKSALSQIGGGSIEVAWDLLKEYMKDQL